MNEAEKSKKWEEKMQGITAFLTRSPKASAAQMAEEADFLQWMIMSKHIIGAIEKELRGWEDQVEELHEGGAGELAKAMLPSRTPCARAMGQVN